MAESIQQLRIYTTARVLEDQVYEFTKSLPTELTYPLGNDLRRSSAAVSHHISEAHRRYSYTLKLESLAAARDAAEVTQKLLEEARVNGANDSLISGYTGVIKQSWGLIKYLKNRRAERMVKAEIKTKDEVVSARS